MSEGPTAPMALRNVPSSPAPETKLLCLSDKIEHNFVTGISLSFPTEYFGPAWINDFETTDWKKVSNFKRLEYLLRVFPGGDSDRNRGFISVQIELKKPDFATNETYIVFLGIRVAGDDRIQTFTFVGEDPQCIYIPQFVSHDYIKTRQLAKNECVKIECSAVCQPVKYCFGSKYFKMDCAHQDYPSSEPFEGPVDTIGRRSDFNAASLFALVSVYHRGY